MRRLGTWMMLCGAGLAMATGSVQAEEDLIALFREDVRAAKLEIVTHSMELDSAQSDLFWPIYQEYQAELSELADRRVAAIKRYAEEHEQLTDDRASEMATDWFRLQGDRLKLRKKYYKQVAKAISAGVAARFIQVENQISLLIDLQIAQDLPLIHTP